jgi:hypothetical protein
VDGEGRRALYADRRSFRGRAAAYAVLAASAFAALTRMREALFGIGAAALLLLFVGIHNVWDSVVYIVYVKRDGERES